MPHMEFGEVWKAISVKIRPGASLPNWTVKNNYLGDVMTIVEVTNEKIVVDAPNAKNFQSISKRDFELIWAVWPMYKSGEVGRQTIRSMTRYSKYIISIFRSVDQE